MRIGSRPISRKRVLTAASILAVTECALFIFLAAGAHGLIVPLDQPNSTDFVSFHAAGALANAGTPWLAYDRLAHHAAQQAASGIGVPYNYFYYPPVFLLLCSPLARLPYLVSFVVFQALSGVACLAALRLARRDLPLIIYLAFPGFWWAIGTGQNALLTAALFTAGLAWIDRRPLLAGLCFGALCYKPHFGLLIPVALIAGSHGRAMIGAVISVLSLTAASVAVFGLATWQAFFTAAANAAHVYAAEAIFMHGLTSPYGVLMVLGVGREAAVIAQIGVIMAAAAIVAWTWRANRAPLPVRAAILLAATPIAVPVMMFYDLMLVFAALVWLSKSPNRPIVLMTAVFLGPLLSGNLSIDGGLMVAAITAAAAFALALGQCFPQPAHALTAAA